MLYSEWITNMRRQNGDTRRRVHIDWTADGSTTVFQMPDDSFPVLDQSGTYVIKVNGVTKTETTDFTLDKETGTLVFLVAPTVNYPVSIDSSAVYVTDAGYLQIGNDVILSLGDDFFKEFVDTSLTTTANALTLGLVSPQPKCIAVYDFFYRSGTSENWQPVENFQNWRYDRESNVIYLSSRDVFTTTGHLLKIRGLKGYTLGTAVSDTIDLQDRFLTILEKGFMARYYQYQYKRVIELVSKNTTENTRTPLQEFMMLADRFQREYEIEKAKLKPPKPARMIPVFKEGVGRP